MRSDLKSLGYFALAACAASLLGACTFSADAEPEDEVAAEGQLADAEGEGDAANGSPKDEVPDPMPSPEEPAEMAETAWAANDNDGAIYTTFIDADGAYRDFRDGAPHQIGSWDMPGDNRLCFQPDNAPSGDADRTCWTVRPPGEDGVMVALGKDGAKLTIRQIEYVAPEDE